MYKPQITPQGVPRFLDAQDGSAVISTVTKAFGMPVNLTPANIPMLRGIAHGAREPGPWEEIIKVIEATGGARIEAIRLPDVQTGLTGPDVMNIAR